MLCVAAKCLFFLYMNQHFNIELAALAGIKESILFQKIYFLVSHNKDQHIQLRDGKYWISLPVSEIELLCPYMSKKSIRMALLNLEKLGYIKSFKFNEKLMDSTKSYTITELYKNLI